MAGKAAIFAEKWDNLTKISQVHEKKWENWCEFPHFSELDP